jgi:hypothetical protein
LVGEAWLRGLLLVYQCMSASAAAVSNPLCTHYCVWYLEWLCVGATITVGQRCALAVVPLWGRHSAADLPMLTSIQQLTLVLGA